MTLPQPDQQQRADIQYVLSLTNGERQHHLFDFSDEHQYRYAVAKLIRAGKTPDRYPGLHEMLSRSRDEHIKNGPPKADAPASGDNVFISGPQITNSGLIPSTRNIAGMGYHTQIGGTSMTQVVCEVVNSDTNGILASGSNAQYNLGEYVPVQTNDAMAAPASTNMTTSISYFYQTQPGHPMQSGSISFNFKRLTTSDPVVTQPVKTQAKIPAYIVVGLGRGNYDKTAVDYWFWQDKEEYPNLAVPLVGNVTFDNPIQPLNPNTTITLFVDLAKAGGGHVQPTGAAMANVYNNFKISQANNKTLTFDLPANGVQATTNPIVFGVTTWVSDTVTYLTVNMFVNLQGQSTPSYASISSSLQANPDIVDGTTYIKPIQFVWHCLAAGTEIAMADGSMRKIETLVSGEAVSVNNDGGTMKVESTIVAPHRGPALRLTMADGKELVLSDGHAVTLPDGETLIAEELEAGDKLTVLGGVAEIAGVENIEFDGLLFNLSLANDDTGEPTTMFANGILVGDHAMQSATRKRRRTRPERVRSAIDPIFLPDYESYLQDIGQTSP